MEAIAVLFDGLKATDTEERFLKDGHEHSERVKKIAKTYFADIKLNKKK